MGEVAIQARVVAGATTSPLGGLCLRAEGLVVHQEQEIKQRLNGRK
jgi:hypothetical protein